ncbi:glycosyltransferase family 4 protein [Streptomyces polygonati]|uniref:D-inositol 3-phosphate glycosyltransferase n=1 Tax=Streptomyces polygonati TaxID=1617087 RepID=A0ABV8HXE3_9ACTN
MRLLLATDVTTRGGVDGYVLALADALRRGGHSVVLLLEESTTSALREDAARRGLDVRFAKQYHRRHSAAEIRADSTRVLDELSPDGVHVTCGSPWSCLGLREVAVARGLPLIVTEQQVHEALVLDADARERMRASYLAARAVIFVSEGNRATMRRVVGLDGVRNCVIPNGVDTARLPMPDRPALPRSDHAGARLMTAARLAPEKALHLLIEAVSALPASMVGTVNLFGEGPEHDRLDRLVQELGLRSRVFLRPWSDRIAEHLAEHDLFVLPSRAEGMPFALLEAMAVGLPVVASDVAGNAEALLDGAAGTLVPQGDSTALADGIRRALTDPAETLRRSRVGAAHVRSHHDLPRLLLKTVDLWTPPSERKGSTPWPRYS